MSFFRNFMNSFFPKTAQLEPKKPTVLPEDALVTDKSQDQQLILAPDNSQPNNLPSDQAGSPMNMLNADPNNHQLNHDPNMTGPETRIDPIMPTNPVQKMVTLPNEKQLKTPFILDLDDVNNINPKISQRMKQLGIKYVSKELFMEHYNALCKEAAMKKIPVSELIDGKYR